MADTKNLSPMDALELAPIGNGRVAALVDAGGRIVWWCFPRLDSDPVFSRLLAGDEEKGFCDVVVHGSGAPKARSAYVRNTAIVETILEDESGNAIKISDFAPRFLRFERAFHPAQIIRRIELPLALPLIFAGIRTAVVFVVATATIAAVAGGGGLGDIIVNQAAYGLEGVVGAAICVSVLALAADGLLGLVQRALTPPGLRASTHAFEPDVGTGVTRR